MNTEPRSGGVWQTHFRDRKAPLLILSIALALGVLLWIADAAVDSFVFYEKGFLDLLLLSPPKHEIYIRFLILICFVAFGGVVGDVVLNVQRKRSELQAMEKRLRTTLQSIGDGVIATDTQGRVQRMNEQSEILTGWSQGDAKGQPLEAVFRIVNSESREQVANPVRKVLQEGTIQGLANHTALIAKDGRELQIADSASPIRDEDESITGVVLIFRDVTEQYRQEEALRRSESYYRTVFQTTGTATVVFDQDTIISQVNTNFEALSGYSRQEIEGEKSWTEFVHPEDRERMQAYHALRQQDPEAAPGQYEHRFLDRGGGEHHILISVDMIPGTGQRVASFMDITEQKQAHEELQAAHHKMDTLVRLNADGIMVLDRQGLILFTNPAAREMLGRSEQELLDLRFGWPVVPEGSTEIELLSSSGEMTVVEMRARPTQWEGQEAILASFRDVTDRKQAEVKVSHLNRVLRAVRNVNQLITVERDRDRLIQGACDTLVETRGFDNAWIALLDGAGELSALAEYGRKELLASLPERCRQCDLPYCARQALARSELVVVRDPEATCASCPFSRDRENRKGIAVPLKHKGTTYGVLSLSLPPHFVPQEEQDLVREVGEDLGFALHGMGLEAERVRNESERDISLRMLRQLDRHESVPDLISGVTSLLKEWSGFDAIGVRLQQGDDYPYFETRGFPEEHVRLENSLCEVDAQGETVRDAVGNPVLECMCGNVIRGRFDPELPFFTEKGSFWTNSTTDLLASTSEADRQARTRNRCQGEGYESVALIPLRHGEQTLGLLQLNDSRRDLLSERWIHLLERLADNLALGLIKRQAEDGLRERERLFRQLFEHAPVGIFIANTDHRIIDANAAALSTLGYAREEILEMSGVDLVPSGDLKANPPGDNLQRLYSGETVNIENRFRTREGEDINVLVNMARMPYYSGESSHMVMFQDISQRKHDERKIYNLAYFDELTGLPNRISFQERLEKAIARSARTGGGAVFMVNITRLREVNDSLGQGAGNELIREVGRRIRERVNQEHTVARVSGGEFSVLAEATDSSDEAWSMGMRILEGASRGLELSGRSVYPGVSIGFTLFPRMGAESDTLLKQADMAETEAKQSTLSIQEFVGQEDWISQKFHLEQDLKNALAQEEFFLCYQPQMDLRTGDVVGMEALLRWHHPERGVVSPGEFIPLLEHTGLIVPVDQWVVHSVCEQLKSWQEKHGSVRAGINLSAQDFNGGNIVGAFRKALEGNGLDARNIIVEITETCLMQNMDKASGILQTFSEWGMQIALDDFGKGYSCMSYLQQLGIHVIKIDKEFVSGLPEKKDSVNLVQTIISMAHNMGKLVLAEGVEREEQRQLLRDMGCDYGQGFLWGYPEPADTVFNTIYGT